MLPQWEHLFVLLLVARVTRAIAAPPKKAPKEKPEPGLMVGARHQPRTPPMTAPALIATIFMAKFFSATLPSRLFPLFPAIPAWNFWI